ncbi:MAG: Mur ligase family protein [Candidatus Absconditabacterales bacterium]|nr:Mur ligase family protein [Candidatus Absconditabacterales bacterium]
MIERMRKHFPDNHRTRLLYHRIKAVCAYVCLGWRIRLCVKKTIPHIGITGTDGKTSCTLLTGHMLAALGYRVGLFSGEELRIGDQRFPNMTKRTTLSPRSLWIRYRRMIIADVDVVVIEVSSHALTQWRVLGVPFTHGVLTNLSHEHLDYYGTMDAYASSKSLLASLVSRAAVPFFVYDPSCLPFASRQPFVHTDRCVECQNLPYSHSLDFRGLQLTFDHQTLQIPFFHTIVLRNIAFVRHLLLSLGHTETAIFSSLAGIAPIPGRMERIIFDENRRIMIFIDFAVTPFALKSSLCTLRPLVTGRLMLVFGCTGGNHDRSKRPLMTQVAHQFADYVIVTEDELYGEPFSSIVADMNVPPSMTICQDREQAIQMAVRDMKEGDCLIVTGMGRLPTRNTAQGEVVRSDAACICASWQIYQQSHPSYDVSIAL